MKTQVKRRRQFRTDYKRRRELLKSERPRLVFRRTNRYFIVQYVVSSEAQDKIKFGTTSKELLKYGWPREFENSIKFISCTYPASIRNRCHFSNQKRISNRMRKNPGQPR